MKRTAAILAIVAVCLTQAVSLTSCVTSSELAGGLFLGLLMTIGDSDEWIETSVSPDENHTLEAYRSNGGATTDFAVKVYRITDRRREEIYFQYHKKDVNISWESNDVVNINGVTLDLSKGETFSSYNYPN